MIRTTVAAAVLGLLWAAEPARADFPDLMTSTVIPGCQIARAMDGSEAAVSAAVQTFADKPALALGAAYCAAWAAEAFDRYAEKPGCFTNDMSIDDLILVVINDAARHPAWKDLPFLSTADGAIFDRWPECRENAK